MPARTRLALALLLARRGRAEEAIGEGAPPGRRCSGDQYRNGSWVQIDNKTFRYPYRLTRDPSRNPYIKGWAYAGRRFWGSCDEGMATPRRAAMQRWQPRDCDLQPFVASHFCERWRRQPLDILFVGDSFTGQMFTSLVAMLGGAVIKNEGAPRTAAQGAIVFGDLAIAELRADALACVDLMPDAYEYVNDVPGRGMRPPLRISFVRNEMLEPNTVEPDSHYRHQYPWTHLLTPKTLFITQALAWFGRDAPHFNRSLHALHEAAASRMSEGNPRWREQILVYSASYAHTECLVETSRRWVTPARGPKRYQHDYGALNAVGAALCAEFGFSFVDITSMLRTRGDGHMPHDCGHWCLPGPYDISTHLLHNAILGDIELPIAALYRLSRRASAASRRRRGAALYYASHRSNATASSAAEIEKGGRGPGNRGRGGRRRRTATGTDASVPPGARTGAFSAGNGSV